LNYAGLEVTLSEVDMTASPAGLDLSSLDAFFRDLTQALAARQVVAAPFVAHDADLLEPLESILNALAGYRIAAAPDLPVARLGNASTPAETSLEPLLTRLRDSWVSHVRARLAPQKVKILATLLASTTPDFLGLLDLSADENRHSAVLRWLLDPRCAPTIALPALVSLAKRLPDPSRWEHELRSAAAGGSLSVRREYTIRREWTNEDSLARIDIVVTSPTFVLAVENKVEAREHGEQTHVYWDWLAPLQCLRAGLLLSPAGFPAACEDFKALTYLELLGCLLEGPSATPSLPEERTVLESYVKTLASGILSPEIHAICHQEVKTK
jgi:hypothetical protein